MSKASLLIAIVVLCAVAPASASAGVPELCRLVPMKQLARPAGVKRLAIRGDENQYGNAPGVLCQFTKGRVLVAASRVLTEPSDAAARTEFQSELDALTNESRHPIHGAWNDARYIGTEGILVLKGQHIFELDYPAPKVRATRAQLHRMAAIAAAKL
jgi:hypothetical protein